LPGREFDPTSIDIGAFADTAHDLAAEVPRADTFDAPVSDDTAPADAAGAGFEGLVSAEDMDWSSSSESYESPSTEDPGLAELLATTAAAVPADSADPDIDGEVDGEVDGEGDASVPDASTDSPTDASTDTSADP